MDVQSAANLNIPEGSVRNIHDKDKRLLWSAVGYNVRYDGNTTQQTYTGKNLLYIPDGTYTENGITWVRSNGSIHGTGKLQNQVWSYTTSGTGYLLSLPSGTYTFSIKSALAAPLRVGFSARDNDNNRIILNIPVGQTSVTQTFSNGLKSVNISLNSGVIGEEYDILLENLQIEAGSSATTFEPYVGGYPAPNPDYPQDVNVVQGKQTILASGKNLFLIPETETKNGVTLTKNSDGTFNLSGTATATATFNIKLDAMIESGTYTLSKSEGNFIAVVQDYLNTSWLSQLITLNYNVNSVTTSINPVGNRVSFVIQARNGITYNLQNVKIQLEKNPSATQFEVHQNKIVNFDLRGKNLLYMPDGTNVSQNITWVVSDGVATGNGTTTSTFTGVTTFKLNSPLPAGTYTFSRPEASKYVLEFAHDDSNGNTYNGVNYRIPSNQTSKTFTITHDIAKITVALLRDPNDSNLGTLTNFSFRAQLEIGNAATTYQPYHAPIELCKIGSYQDYIYKGADGWYVHKDIGKIILDGSNDEDWGISYPGTSNYFYRYKYLTNFIYDGSKTPWVSNIVTHGSIGSTTTTEGGMITDVGEVRIRYGTEMSLADWLAKLATTNMILYYALATPTNTKITDTTIITQLDAIHDWLRRYDYYGVVSGNLPIIINRSGII